MAQPCICTKTIIQCNDNQNFDLKLYFKELSEKIGEGDKHFDQFLLNNTAIEVLENNTFNDITFETIVFNNTLNLKEVAFDVFQEPNWKTVLKFEQLGETLLGTNAKSTNDIFFALSQLKKIEKLVFDSNQFKFIPAYSFGYTNSLINNVSEIIFNKRHNSQQHIQWIGDNAFYNLNNLTNINLTYNEINFIHRRAFDFWKDSENLLIIDLSYNFLNDSSIEKGAFTNSKRPLFVDLSHNNITFLDQNIFEPILKQNRRNRISICYNPLHCDSRMDWILNNHSLAYLYQVFDLNCQSIN